MVKEGKERLRECGRECGGREKERRVSEGEEVSDVNLKIKK